MRILNYQIPKVQAGITLRDTSLKELQDIYSGIVVAEQVHGSSVAVITNLNDNVCADALLTRSEQIMLVVKTADCLPVLINDPVKKVVGTVHAGRKGTLEQILSKALSIMSVIYHSQMEQVILHFGPHITMEHYEIEPGLKFDILGQNIKQASQAGIKTENMIISGYCTYFDNDKFYSYRKEQQTSLRNYSFIKLAS